MKVVFFLMMIPLFFLLNATSVEAACTYTPDTVENVNWNVQDIIVPLNASIGQQIGEADHNDSFSQYITDCKYYNDIPMIGSNTGLKGKNNCPVYSTSVPGVGYTIIQIAQCLNSEWDSVIPSTMLYTNVNIYFYKTGDIQSGSLVGLYSEVHGDQHSPVTIAGTKFSAFSVMSGSVTSQACNLGNANIQVPLNDISVDRFTGVGMSQDEKSFTISLTCNAKTNISVTLNGDKSSETSDDSVLGLTNIGGPGVASGVGVQILNNGTPLSLGSSVALQPTTENIEELLPFSARYYQTKQVVTPGEADASATLDITYQ